MLRHFQPLYFCSKDSIVYTYSYMSAIWTGQHSSANLFILAKIFDFKVWISRVCVVREVNYAVTVSVESTNTRPLVFGKYLHETVFACVLCSPGRVFLCQKISWHSPFKLSWPRDICFASRQRQRDNGRDPQEPEKKIQKIFIGFGV